MSEKITIHHSRASQVRINAPSMAGSRYVRLRELKTMVPFSVPTIWRKSRDGSFPPAIKLSAGITAWNRESVEQWLSAKEGVQ